MNSTLYVDLYCVINSSCVDLYCVMNSRLDYVLTYIVS